MADDVRWDAEMLAARRRMDAAAAAHPPVVPVAPLDPHRAVSDILNLPWAEGGPAMAETSDRWVFARGRRILCRLHRPHAAAAGPLPVLVWFHGGGWVWSSVDTHDRLVREYADAAGIAALSVDYSLAPEARFPVALLECVGVVAWLQREGAAWGLDPSRIVLGGDSAGGNLALATALALRDDGAPAPRGVLAAYPVTDCDFDTPSYLKFATGFGLTRESMRRYWDLYTRDAADRRNPLAAPLRADLTGFPTTLIQVAELDVLRSDGERMAERLGEAGVPVVLERYDGVAHGFMRLTGAVGTAQRAVARGGRMAAGGGGVVMQASA